MTHFKVFSAVTVFASTVCDSNFAICTVHINQETNRSCLMNHVFKYEEIFKAAATVAINTPTKLSLLIDK